MKRGRSLECTYGVSLFIRYFWDGDCLMHHKYLRTKTSYSKVESAAMWDLAQVPIRADWRRVALLNLRLRTSYLSHRSYHDIPNVNVWSPKSREPANRNYLTLVPGTFPFAQLHQHTWDVCNENARANRSHGSSLSNDLSVHLGSVCCLCGSESPGSVVGLAATAGLAIIVETRPLWAKQEEIWDDKKHEYMVWLMHSKGRIFPAWVEVGNVSGFDCMIDRTTTGHWEEHLVTIACVARWSCL